MGPKSKESSDSSSDSSSGSGSSDSESGSNSSQSDSESSESVASTKRHSTQSRGLRDSNGDIANSALFAEDTSSQQRVVTDGKTATENDHDEDEEDDENPGFTKKKKSIKEILREAAEQPDLYGVRRSGRQRKEVERLVIKSDEEKAKRGRRGRSSRQISKTSTSEQHSEDGSSSESSEFSDGFRPTSKNARRSTRNTRSTRTKQSKKNNSTRSRGRQHYSSDSDDDSDDDKRRKSSSRGAGKTVSYKEDTDEHTASDDLVEVEEEQVPQVVNNAETIERVLRKRRGRKGASGTPTTYYNVLDHGDPCAGFRVKEEDGETQYYIKWKTWSHIHNTWETEHALVDQKINGMKRLENFQKKDREIADWKRYATPEDREYYEYQAEMIDQLQDNYYKVERIITHTVPKDPAEYNGFPEYLVKWCGLPYSECTWEDGRLLSEKFADAVEEYNFRHKSQKIPPKSTRVNKYRPKFSSIKLQPDYIGNEELILRDYQLEGLNWLVHAWCKHNGCILADEMGLGKTMQTIAFVNYLMNQHQLYGPFLIVVPLSTIATWQMEFKRWAPEINIVVYLGDISSRQMIRDYEWCHAGNKRLKFNVIITTYEILLKDKSYLGGTTWAVLAVDEAHRLKNDDSLLYKSLFQFDTYHRLLITGTPLQNSLKELWSLLHFIMPDKFDDWDEFEDQHISADKTGFALLHKELEPYLLRRVKKDVEKSLPAKTEQILRVEMSKVQKQYYKWILTKNYRELSRGPKGSVSSFINIVMELKKCCNHAFLTRLPEDETTRDRLEALVKSSGKLILLDKLLLRLKEGGHRVLIFSQMVRMLDILEEYLKLRRFSFQRLDGTIRGDIRKQALDHFNADDSLDFCFLLSTRAGGLGVNLATADTVIIFDSDWNPQNDLQAMARAHRIGQKKQVSVYRLVTKSSVEEDIVERAKKKMVLDHLVIQRMDTTGRTVLNRSTSSIGSTNPFNKEELSHILKFGAEQLFNGSDDEDDETQVDLDQILNRAETRDAEDEEDEKTGELLGGFKVVNFENMENEELERPEGTMQKLWEDIIPEADRKQIEAQEEEEKLKELNLPPRERKQIQNLDTIFESDDDGKRKRRHRKQKADDSDSDDAEHSDDDSDGDKPKKRGRPKAGAKKEGVKNFKREELRQFVKSFKKFPEPLERLDAIAGDAELQEKSNSDLRKLGEKLYSLCEQAMEGYDEKLKQEMPVEERKRLVRGPTFKLVPSIVINAKSVLQAINDLKPLVQVLSADKNERKKFTLECHVKAAHFDCAWDNSEDAALLRGVYEYGMGNWEAIKMDPDFNLHDKILPDANMKPQAKHLQTRTEFLLRVLRKHLNAPADKPPKSRKSKKKEKAASNAAVAKLSAKSSAKVKSAELVEDDSDSSDDDAADSAKKKRDRRGSKESREGDEEMEEGEVKDEKKAKKKKKEKKPKKQAGPVHITTSDTVAISKEIIGSDLPEDIFTQCKEKMRPVKKSLKLLDNPDPGLPEKDQLGHTRHCLLKIGNRITQCLAKLSDPEAVRDWRTHLWIFVSKFTEFDATRLHKLYKHAVKTRGEDAKSDKHHHHNHHHNHHGQKKRHHDRDHEKPSKVNSEQHSDASRDGFSHFANGPRPKDRLHDVKDSKWGSNSPLSRPDDHHRKPRYDNAYNRVPNQGQQQLSRKGDPRRGFQGPPDRGPPDRYNNDGRRPDYHSGYGGRDSYNRGDFRRQDYPGTYPLDDRKSFYDKDRKRRADSYRGGPEWRGAKDPRLQGPGGDAPDHSRYPDYRSAPSKDYTQSMDYSYAKPSDYSANYGQSDYQSMQDYKHGQPPDYTSGDHAQSAAVASSPTCGTAQAISPTVSVSPPVESYQTAAH